MNFQRKKLFSANLKVLFYDKCRDIYYAKYYGKGGGEKWIAGEKNEIRS